LFTIFQDHGRGRQCRFKFDDTLVDELVGVGLPAGTIQSELSPHLARVFEDLVRDDPAYRERIKRHYEQFKAASGERFTEEEALTVDECLAELEDLELTPKMEWFEKRPNGCDSAAALLDLHAPDLDPADRLHARALMRRLWECWVPDAPCLETCWERACALLREAGPEKPRAEQEAAWRCWLTRVSDLLLDSDGRITPAAVRALEEDDGPAGVIETLLCSAVPMLTEPLFEPALELLERVDASGLEGGRRFELVRAMALVHRGDLAAALKLFDRLARQESQSLAVHLAAGHALLAAGGADSRTLRQAEAEWYLARARQRADSVRDWDRALLDASLESLHARR